MGIRTQQVKPEKLLEAMDLLDASTHDDGTKKRPRLISMPSSQTESRSLSWATAISPGCMLCQTVQTHRRHCVYSCPLLCRLRSLASMQVRALGADVDTWQCSPPRRCQRLLRRSAREPRWPNTIDYCTLIKGLNGGEAHSKSLKCLIRPPSLSRSGQMPAICQAAPPCDTTNAGSGLSSIWRCCHLVDGCLLLVLLQKAHHLFRTLGPFMLLLSALGTSPVANMEFMISKKFSFITSWSVKINVTSCHEKAATLRSKAQLAERLSTRPHPSGLQ